MDPVRDKHFSNKLSEQMKEIENIKGEVNNLKSKYYRTLVISECNFYHVLEVKHSLFFSAF